jgi:hypothetical protein
MSHADWTLVADPGACTLMVQHARLGCLLTNVQLNIPTGPRLVPAKGWTVNSEREGLLQIKTAQPQSTWLLDLGPLALKISCTARDAALTAEVPVGRLRPVVLSHSETEAIIGELQPPYRLVGPLR